MRERSPGDLRIAQSSLGQPRIQLLCELFVVRKAPPQALPIALQTEVAIPASKTHSPLFSDVARPLQSAMLAEEPV